MNFRYKIAQFFYGRYMSYGVDLLSKVLAVVCVILAVLNIVLSFVGLEIVGLVLYLIETVLFVWMFFRLFSKNIPKRQAENRKLTDFIGGFKKRANLRKRMNIERDTHIYRKCPHCSVMLRLPRRPGRHNVNCPRCRNNFEIKVK